MNRRSFLKGLLATTALAVPSTRFIFDLGANKSKHIDVDRIVWDNMEILSLLPYFEYTWERLAGGTILVCQNPLHGTVGGIIRS